MKCRCIKKCFINDQLYVPNETADFDKVPKHFVKDTEPEKKGGMPELKKSFDKATRDELMGSKWSLADMKKFINDTYKVTIRGNLGKVKMVDALFAAKQKVK